MPKSKKRYHYKNIPQFVWMILCVAIGALIYGIFSYVLFANPQVYSPKSPVSSPPLYTPMPTATPSPTRDPEESFIYQCSTDSDCISIATDSCGKYFDTAINKQYFQEWKSRHVIPTPQACTMNAVPVPQAACEDNVCKVIHTH